MKLIEHVDFTEIFKKVKDNQLRQFPTVQEYKEYLEDVGEPTEFVENLYKDLLGFYNKLDREWINLDTWHDNEIIDLENKKIYIVLSQGELVSNESYTDWEGTSWTFVVDLEEELFIDYYEE